MKNKPTETPAPITEETTERKSITELAAIVLRIVDTLHLQDGQTKTWKPLRDELEKVING